MLFLIGQLGAKAGTGYAVEYAGSTVRGLDVEARLTLCNLSIELGAKVGMIAPDDNVYAYLEGRDRAPRGARFDLAVDHWRTLVPPRKESCHGSDCQQHPGIRPME